MSATLRNIYAAIPQTARAKSVLMGGDPKGKNFLYICENSIVIRNIENPLLAELYEEHQYAPTVARYAPSGFYIASGDSVGNVRIWDTTQADHKLKIEIRALGGPIRDLAWSVDSQRIVVGGEGREKYGHAFFWDSGASVGEIGGHAKPINSVDVKPTRPFRAVTGSEDFVCNWYEGPPFKYKTNVKEHTRFVNCVRFSPDGNLWASASSDKNVILYDGKDCTKKAELKGHDGGVYCVSWSPDSSRLLTASADKTAKIWDVNTGQVVTTFHLGDQTEDQQLGCLWQGPWLLSVALSGHISYLDPNNNARPTRILKGHNKAVTSFTYDNSNNYFYSASYDAVLTRWNVSTGENTNFTGKGHTNQISNIELQADSLFTGAMDDSLRVTSASALVFGADKIGVDSPVVALDVSKNEPGLLVAVTLNTAYVVRGGQIAGQLAVGYAPKSVAIAPRGDLVAFGGEDNNIHLLSLSGNTLSEVGTLSEHRSPVTALAFSSDGQHLASGDKGREILVWNVASKEAIVRGWVYHTARVNWLSWSSDNVHVASAGLDENLFVWNVNEPSKRIQIKHSHKGGVNKVVWINDRTLASCGQDCNLKTWDVTY